ncbi:metallophosphoesterase family protein [Hyphomicrobium sp.]|uniref:metallophosphoesterase family protein n=1 Tax=Hyphomicrobium sp. TaxID=82 RepID=UPI002E350B99|nr:metallophosphoesterase [Hyphomicrobium sp.]HEX2841836.1 metallophosphoesterase [Hyphomicrobium sp.]
MIVDPRQGDIEDDASSTKSHSLLSLAGSLLVEVSLPKLIVAWLLLVILPAVIVGLSPLIVTAWIAKVGGKISTSLFGIVPLAIFIALLTIGWMFGRKLFHLAEASFWSLNALAIEPAYTMCREILRHLAEWMLPESAEIKYREHMRAWAAPLAGVLITAFAVAIFLLAWPHSRWIGESADLLAPRTLAWITLANTLVLASAYLAVAALFWAFADMTMPPPRDLIVDTKPSPSPTERTWRVAHLSDLHIVGERYGFRIESGRTGPQGNARVRRVFDILEGIDAAAPLDLILISGDATDAGRASEWAEFLDIVADFPTLRDRVFILPGNHDLNIVDRANPARLDLSIGPNSRLRKIRTLSAINAIQGTRVHVVDHTTQRLGQTLSTKLKDPADQIAKFADTGRPAFSTAVSTLWNDVFPMAVPPRADDGLGLILLNSNSDSHFSFTNALGMIPEEQMRGIEILARQYPRAHWLIGLHHHVIEYPRAAKVLSERIGTALVNGNWFLRRLRPLASRAVLMHGHRHIDWIGECGGMIIVSAPSPVMEATNDLETYFYIHTLEATEKQAMRLLQPQRVCVPGERTKPEEKSKIDKAGKGSKS